MPDTRHRLAAFGIAVALLGLRLSAQRAEPVLGTWVLNIAKSTFSPGPPPKSDARTYVMADQETKITFKGVNEPRTYRLARQEIKVTAQGVDSDGKPTMREWTVAYDGQDRPMTGDPDADTVSFRRIDALTTEFVLKKASRIVITGTGAISKDGSVMTITSKGVNAAGQATHNVLLFDKQ